MRYVVPVSTNCTLCQCEARNIETPGYQRCYDPFNSISKNYTNLRRQNNITVVSDNPVFITNEVRENVCVGAA
jgi:hypothetical protein